MMKKKIIEILYSYSNKDGYQSVGEVNFEQVADDIMITLVMMDDKIPPRSDTVEKKLEDIFVLMNIAKMTLTEINTLTRRERETLAKWFVDKEKQEMEYQKNKYKL